MNEMEGKYRAIFEFANDAIFIMENDKIVDCNQRALTMFNCSRKDIINATPYKFSPAKQLDGRDSKTEALEKINATLKGKPQRFEWVHITKDNQPFNAEVSLNKYSIADDEIILAIVRDVTNYKKAKSDVWAAKQQLEAQNQQLAATEQQLRAEIRDRIETQNKLKISENILNTILENISYAVFAYNLDGQFVLVNEKATEYTGYSKDDLLEMTVADINHESISRNDREHLWAELIHGGHKQFISNHFRKDGSTYPVETSVTAISIDNKPVFIAVAQDITKRLQSEKALLESKENLRITLNSIGDAVIATDTEGRIVRMNSIAEQLLGLTLDQAQGKPLDDLFNIVNVVTGEKVDNPVSKVLEYGEIVGLANHTKLIANDGKEYQIADSAAPIRNKKGDVLGVVLVFRDVTEEYRVRQALKESQERLDLAMWVTNDGIWDWDLKTNTVYFDERYYTMAGYKVNAFPQTLKEFQKRVHPEDLTYVMNHVDRYLKGIIDVFDIEYRFAHANQNWIWIRGRGKIVERDENGIPLRFVGTHADITERKMAEESLRNMQKLESLGVLAGGIAHDFNNLMQSIFGYIDLAMTETKEVNVVKFLTEAMNSIERASALTRQLLTFAKGGAPIKKLARLIPFIERTVNFALSGSNISCSFEISDDLSSCEYDENQLAQVIDNIIINAEQAMPDGGRLEVSAQNVRIEKNENVELPEGSYVKISIRDHGIGMPREILPKIFDPFYTTKTKGHGLGLSTCYSIIKRHGGAIEVESEPGFGSTFNIFLPTSGDAISRDREKESVKHAGEGIFVVMDDEKSVRIIAQKMLERFGYTVILKEDGEQVIEYFTTEHKNVVGVILDLTIPGGMGGQDTVVEVRKIRDDIPVFVASGYAFDPVMSDPQKYGFTASITKPFTRAGLAEVLNKYLSGEKKPPK